MTQDKKRQIIDVRRMYDRTVESVKKRGEKLSKKYKFEIIDEHVSPSLHIILADLTKEQIQQINNDSMVLSIENLPRISLN